MQQRARAAGRPISRSTLNGYALGRPSTQPARDTALALAAALGVTFEEVAAAVQETFGLDEGASPEARRMQRSEAWLRLTDDRTEREVDELLVIVEQVLRMRDLDALNGSPKTD